MKMTLKSIRKKLLAGRIRITIHARRRMIKRGYSPSDVMLVIMQGQIHEYQSSKGRLGVVLVGEDVDSNPLAVVIGPDDKHPNELAVVSVFPTIDKSRFIKVI